MKRWSVPVRTALVAMVAMSIAMAIAGFALVTSLRASLLDEIDRSLVTRAADVGSEIELPNEFLSLDGELDDSLVIGVVALDGVVLADTDVSLDGDAVLDIADEAPVNTPFDSSLELRGTNGADNLRALVRPGEYVTVDEEDPDFDVVEDVVIIIGTSLDGVDSTVRRITTGALIAGPLLVLLVGALTWWLTRLALRPVDRIRQEVDEISGTGLDRRVPEPETGDEIGRLARTMNQMLGRLEESQQAQRRFVSDASHELRSPLASMAAQIDVARRHDEPSEMPAVLDALRSDTTRMHRLVEDLLLLARADAGEAARTSVRRLVDLDDIVLATVREVAVQALNTNFDTSAVSAGLVHGDADQLSRVVRNLVDNAARHAMSSVAVALTEHDGSVLLTVDDDGAGVPADERQRVFERFIRLDEGRARDAGGSGLGLAITAEIVRAHDGTISLGDAPSGGARFTVALPATTA